MVTQELISQVVTEVLRQLSVAKKTSPSILILGKREQVLDTRIQGILGVHEGYVYFSDDYDASAIGRYIVPQLSCSSMADLATGRASDLLTQEILALLLAGKKVEVLSFEYQGYQKTATEALYQLYESYKKTLASFGLKEYRQNTDDSLRLWEKLICEKDVLDAFNEHVTLVQISAKALVTPLAEETAKRLGISILRSL